MSRSEYSEDCDGRELNLWRGAVNSAINGKRGQAFLIESLAALDAMLVKKLTTDSLHDPVVGEFCTLGVVGAARGMALKPLEYANPSEIGAAFGISRAMAAEIMFENDDCDSYSIKAITPERRWILMRYWVQSHIRVKQ